MNTNNPITCQNCPLNIDKQPMKDKGNKDAEILVILSLSDSFSNISLSSEYNFLINVFNNHNINIDNVYFTNAIKCAFNKKASKKILNSYINSCRDYTILPLIKEMPNIKYILLFGKRALQSITGLETIDKHNGNLGYYKFDNKDILVFAFFSYKYLQEKPIKQEIFNIEMNNFKKIYHNQIILRDTKSEFTVKEVDSIRDILEGNLFKIDNFYYTALDTETQGLYWYDENSEIISYSLAKSLNEAYVVVLWELGDENNYDKTIKRINKNKEEIIYLKKAQNFDNKVKELKQLCEREDIRIYYANLKYDKHRLYNLGIKPKNAVCDILLLAHTLDSEGFVNISLNKLISLYCPEIQSHKNLLSTEEKQDMIFTLKNNYNDFILYSGLDAIATLRIGLALRKEISKDKKIVNYYSNLIHKVETELLFDIERNGILIDKNKLLSVKDDIIHKMNEVEKEIKSLLPVAVLKKHQDDFKLTKKSILVDLIYNYQGNNIGYGLKPFNVSEKTGIPSVDKDTLKIILDNHNTPEELKKILSLYELWDDLFIVLNRYIKQIFEFMTKDGFIHPSYSVTFTSSGRTGARNPSIQNFPTRGEVAKYIKQLVIAPEGYYLVKIDYSMAELRWCSIIANETNMKEAFKNNEDIHIKTGLMLAGKTKEEVSEDELKKIRTAAKAANFGLLYGMSWQGFQMYAYTNYNQKYSDEEAQKIRENFFKIYPNLIKWHSDREQFIKKNKYIRQPFGRKRNLVNVDSDIASERSKSIRSGINFEVQNASSDFALLKGYNLYKLLEDIEGVKFISFIHDAFFFYVKKDYLNDFVWIAKSCLQNTKLANFNINIDIPIKVDIEYGESWDLLKKFEEGE